MSQAAPQRDEKDNLTPASLALSIPSPKIGEGEGR